MKYIILIALLITTTFAKSNNKINFTFTADENIKETDVQTYIKNKYDKSFENNTYLNSPITKRELIVYAMNSKVKELEDNFETLISFNEYINPENTSSRPNSLDSNVFYSYNYQKIISMNDITIYGKAIKPITELCKAFSNILSYYIYLHDNIFLSEFGLPFVNGKLNGEMVQEIKNNTNLIVNIKIIDKDKFYYLSCLKDTKDKDLLYFGKDAHKFKPMNLNN